MMGVELELVVLLIVQTVLISSFAKFEIETPVLRKVFKWFIIDSIIITLYYIFGHWALLFLLLLLIPGTTYHFIWCKKNGIHPINATPRKKLYQLRGWKAED